jgi:seryl-tRNA synthetase
MAEVAAIKTELDNSAARLETLQPELHPAAGRAQPAARIGAGGRGRDRQRGVRRWGTPAQFDFEVKDHVDWASRWAWTSTWASSSRARASP